MALSETGASEDGHRYQLVGLTGLGWTVSLLGYLGTVISNGDGPATHVVANPRSLLYLGIFSSS